MESREPSLEDKEAFFRELARLDDPDDSDDIDDDEWEQRARCKAVLTRTGGGHLRTQGSANNPSRGDTSQSQKSQKASPKSAAVYPRRTASSPMPASTGSDTPPAQVQRTPLSELAKHTDGKATAAGETSPIPDSTRARLQPLRLVRSESTPNPVTYQHQRRRQRQPQEESPSTKATMTKRMRETASSSRSAKQLMQIFRGLKFYYFPDNDPSQVRKIRVKTACSHGAVQTRVLSEASHVIVNDGLRWKHVEPILARPDGSKSAAVVVNADYVPRCIEHRKLLNPKQRQYRIPETPTAITEDVSASVGPAASSNQSLQLKPAMRDPKRWDFVPRPETPSRAESPERIDHDKDTNTPSEKAPATQTRPDPQPDTSNHEGPKTTPASAPKDDLSTCINEMQPLRNLPPLDEEENDEDDDDDEGSPPADLEPAGALTSDQESGSEDERTRKKRKTASTAAHKASWESRFACNRASTKDASNDNPNWRAIEMLQRMGDHHKATDQHWESVAYPKAIRTLQGLSYKVTTAEEARELPHIGQRIARWIEEIHTTDHFERLEHAEGEPTNAVLKLFLGIYGVGTAQASKWIQRGLRTLDDVRAKARLSESQRMGVEHYEDLNSRIPRREVEAIGDVVKAAARRLDPRVELIIGGSYRRGADSSGDVDFLVTKKGTGSAAELLPFLGELTEKLWSDGVLVARLASSRKNDPEGSKWHGCCVCPESAGLRGRREDGEGGLSYRPVWRRVDFLVVPESELGAALIYFTGNDIFNRSIRLLASRKNMRLNQRGLYKDVLRGPGRERLTMGELVEGRDEKKIFEILGVQWREPHERWC